MANAVRKTRQSEEVHLEREDESRADVWIPPSTLDAPPPREGMRQRWVATQILGQEVPHHTMRRLREGWVPRPANTVPEDFPVPTIAHGKYGDVIGVEGMILCELPEEKGKQRDKYFSGKTRQQEAFVKAQRESVARAGNNPIIDEGSSGVTRGQRVADDD